MAMCPQDTHAIPEPDGQLRDPYTAAAMRERDDRLRDCCFGTIPGCRPLTQSDIPSFPVSQRQQFGGADNRDQPVTSGKDVIEHVVTPNLCTGTYSDHRHTRAGQIIDIPQGVTQSPEIILWAQLGQEIRLTCRTQIRLILAVGKQKRSE